MVDGYVLGVEDPSMVVISIRVSSNVSERTTDDMYRRSTGAFWRCIPWPCRWESGVLPNMLERTTES